MSIQEVLKTYWGYDTFRNPQEAIIESVLAGNDTLALLPTGAGKSICFQVPIMAQEGIGIVISPLIALMKDQVQQLKRRGIPAIEIVSGMSSREIDIALDNCIYGNVKFLYLSPERLQNELVQERIKRMKVNLLAVDEAHCISQWGYDFRPAYLLINEIKNILPHVPILALTATATSNVVIDIQEKLQFKKPNVFQISFERTNLNYLVLKEENKYQRLLRILAKVPGSAICYVRNRKQTEEYAKFLQSQGISADFYHAGLDMKVRSKKQDEWILNKTNVIIATNAFGMGIDKPAVRVEMALNPLLCFYTKMLMC
jgi:ATP-dependent DNA helicase RecQ